MSQCDLIDEKKYPIVILHQLNDNHVSPEMEPPLEIKKKPIDGLIDHIGIAASDCQDNAIIDVEMKVCSEKKEEEKVIVKKEELEMCAEEVFTVEKDSCLRRSRRLKSIFLETALTETVIEVPMTIEAISQHEIKQEIVVATEKVESIELVKKEEIYETIDVEKDARLRQFITIKDNIYLKPSDKVICKINKTMKCDCTITEDEVKNGELGCTFNCINRLLYIECSPKCRCGEFCDNQQFQRYNYSPVSAFKTEKKGFGIRADADIPPETFIIEYVGEVLNNKQFEKRATKYSKDKNRHYYFMALRSNAVIDATVKGNISRFINHSCDPNAITQKWTINGELRVGFFSVRFIKKGEEITFDYQFQRYGKEAQPCYCESENCRGWIGENPESDEEVSESVENVKDKKLIKSKKVPVSKTKQKSKLADETSEDIKDAEIKRVEPSSVKAERKVKKLYEDLEIEEQIKDLTKSGLKNRAHTIALARLVVRAKSVESRSNILKILIAGDLPCRRLFLDYNGLKLLHTWMCDISVKSSIPDICLCIELLNTLSLLPITNKTVLRDSKVLERVEKWRNLDIEKKKLTKEEKKQAKANKKKVKTSSQDQLATNEGSKEEIVQITMTFDVLEELPAMKLMLKEKASALLQKWEILKEDFRIPKKQKQENRKEHEKEAGMEEDLQQKSILANDRVRNRFGHEINNSRSNTTSSYHYTNSSSSTQYQSSSSNRRYLDPLEKQHRRKQFEKQELEKQMWMEHENNCAIFGLPPDTPLMNVPVKVNRVTGECHQIFGSKVPRPPNFHEFNYEPLTLSTNPDDYRLPPNDLPEHWRFAIDKYGRIYYYHEKIRITQWVRVENHEIYYKFKNFSFNLKGSSHKTFTILLQRR
jgi:histone-lysine N-methyltransferase SETD2